MYLHTPGGVARADQCDEMKEVIAMRKSFRGAVTLASIAMLVSPATLLAQYPIVQPQDGQIVYPQGMPIYQPAIVQPQPVQRPAVPQPAPSSIAQPTQQPAPAQPAPKPATTKPVDDAITKAWLDKVIEERLKEAVAKQAEKVKVEQAKVEQANAEPPKSVEPPKPSYPVPPVIATRKGAVEQFGDSGEDQSVNEDWKTNGITAEIPTVERISVGGVIAPPDQYSATLDHTIGSASIDDISKPHIVVAGSRSFEQKVRQLFETSWKDLKSKFHINYGSRDQFPQLAWRLDRVGLSALDGIVICDAGFKWDDQNSVCQVLHYQPDDVDLPTAANKVLDGSAKREFATEYQSQTIEARRNRNQPLDLSKARDLRRTIQIVNWWFWLACTMPSLAAVIAVIYFRRLLAVPFKWLFGAIIRGYGAKVAEQPVIPLPPTTPIVIPTPPFVPEPTPTVDEMDQVDRSQDARLNRLEEMITKLIDRPTVVEVQPIKRTRKPAKR
jgi:hypothetical protein